MAGIWISTAHLQGLPTGTGPYNAVVSAANKAAASKIDLCDQDGDNDIWTLAAAYIAIRNNDTTKLNTVKAIIDALPSASFSCSTSPSSGGAVTQTNRVLNVARQLPSYLIAADVISYVPTALINWLNSSSGPIFAAIQGHGGGTGLYQTAEKSTNNWGTHARASLAIAAVLTGNATWKSDVVKYHSRWIGVLNGHPMTWDSGTALGWHPTTNDSQKCGINPPGTVLAGHNCDGVLPEDQRRSGEGPEARWPPAVDSHVWGGMAGAVLCGTVLHRAGLLDKSAASSALSRACRFYLQDISASATSDGSYISWVVNRLYSTSYPQVTVGEGGKAMSFTDWTHATVDTGTGGGGGGGGGTAPSPNWSASPRSGTAPLTVNFTNSTTGTAPITYSWDFRDGGTSTATNPSHTYTTAGTYYPKLTASNSAGTSTLTDPNPITVSAPQQAPVANFNYGPTSGIAPLNVSFTDISSNNPTNWDWETKLSTATTWISFGSAKTASYQYTSPGTYNVKLIAWNAAGSDTIIKNVTVNPAVQVPVAAWSARLVGGSYATTPLSGDPTLDVEFRDDSTNGPTSWQWSFGDGTFSTLQNPSHSYSSPGTYTVAMTATNSAGWNELQRVGFITVTDPFPYGLDPPWTDTVYTVVQ